MSTFVFCVKFSGGRESNARADGGRKSLYIADQWSVKLLCSSKGHGKARDQSARLPRLLHITCRRIVKETFTSNKPLLHSSVLSKTWKTQMRPTIYRHVQKKIVPLFEISASILPGKMASPCTAHWPRRNIPHST